jgi:RNA polymerase sigma factor (sigma-70 family)
LAAVSKLNPFVRDAVALRFFDGMSVAEIGHRLGVDARDVSACLYRAKRTLRVHLGDAA